MAALKEYIVCLKRHEDLEGFYDDMETPGGNLYIPDRAIPVHVRRPISRNTHYMLTSEEAEQIRNDDRVLAVELSMGERGRQFRPAYVQTSNLWNKSNGVSSSYKNWGLLRCYEGVQRPNWGNTGTNTVSGTINVTASGRNVDVVIVDGCINPAHPEFAVNPDGTGGSRVIQYNWFELNIYVTGGFATTYQYTPYVDPTYPDLDGDGNSDRTTDNDHGCHVAGIAAGNSQGWARGANIYNINPYGTAPSPTNYFIDYIRAWHQRKPINPETGRKNPTVTNHSYGLQDVILVSSITSLRYRGVNYTGPFTAAQLNYYGIQTTTIGAGVYAVIPARDDVSSFEADILDAIREGIIFVGAAGNLNANCVDYDTSVFNDYNNRLDVSSVFYYFNRGTTPSATPGVICVGATGIETDDRIWQLSNKGTRVDVFSPGRFVMSSVNSTIGVTSPDPRNSSYRITKKTGTSMASPQVCGLLACAVETWPRMSQEDAVRYITEYGGVNQVYDPGGTGTYALLNGPNIHLSYHRERPVDGNVGPKANFGFREQSGQLFPRTNIYRYGR